MSTMAVLFTLVFIGACKKDKYVEPEAICPLVLFTNPADNQLNVPLNQVITVTFNEEMDPATINGSTFIVTGSVVPGTVTYSGVTATFTPTDPLIPDHTYIGKITTDAKDLMGNAIQRDYIWTFSTGNTLAPLVIATDPEDGDSGVLLNKVVTATFNMAMDPLTINSTNYTLKQGNNAVAGTVTYSGNMASFTPSNPLTSNTVYTAFISSNVKSASGTLMPGNYTWTFSTGTFTPPTVISTDPDNNETGVFLNKTVAATFNTSMDPLTINATTFTLKQGMNPVAGTISYSGTTAFFKPNTALTANTVYSATVTTGAKNGAGVAMANNYDWTFTTGNMSAPFVISTDPLNNASGVPLNKVITATFSEPMDPLTLNNLTFTVKQNNTVVTGSISYLGSTVSFTPGSNLLSGRTYTATITTGAKNISGVPMANNHVWRFSTQGSLGPLAPNLRSVARFGIIAGVGVSNNAGFSEIHDMDVGISPGVRSSITGFPPAIVVNGAIYASDDIAPPGTAAMLTQAKQDLTDAYLFAEGATSPAPATIAGDQGGKTLAPGIYKSTSTLMVQNGDLTLDAQGDPNAVWIFQISSDFTTVGGAGGNIILTGGAQAKNIYWQVGSSATIGNGTMFRGNILALTSITMNSGATAIGRMLARNGSVVLTSTNIINKP